MPCWVSPPRPSSQRSLLAGTALQGAKADATLLASYATNAALSASETTLQSALDAILAELAALQLSGSGGVVNAPAWAGFTTWELVRGSNVVRNQRRRHAPPCRQAWSHGGSLALQIAVRFPTTEGPTSGGRHRRADPGPHGRLAVKLDGSPQQRLRRGHAHRSAVSVDGYTLTLVVNPWNIVRTGLRAPLRLPVPARLQGRQATRAPGARPRRTSQCPNGVAKLHFGAHFQAPGCPTRRQTLDVTVSGRNPETGNTAEVEDGGFGRCLDGGSRWHPGQVLLEPTLTSVPADCSPARNPAFESPIPPGSIKVQARRPRLEAACTASVCAQCSRRRQGHSVALQLEASHRAALAVGRTRKLPSVNLYSMQIRASAFRGRVGLRHGPAGGC